MPDYGTSSIMEIWSRIIGIVLIIYFWVCVRRGWFDLRFWGFNTLFVYTGWRVVVLIGSVVVMQGIPVLILGYDQYSELFQARDTLLGLGLFWGNIVGIPLAIIVATLGQMHENRRHRKSKRKSD